jgi:hypothetical protein
MKRSNKILLGAATAFIPIISLLFGAIFFLLFFGGGPHGGAFPVFGLFPVIFLFQLLLSVLTLGLSVFYIVNAVRNDRLTDQMKAIWSIAIFMGGPIGMAVYWYLQIWKEPELAAPTPEQLYAANTADWARPEQSYRQGEYVPPSEPPDWR